MTWTAPTASDLKTRFPQFAGLADAMLNAVLDEAVGEVGPNWVEKDRTPASLLLAAHLLTVEGHGQGAGAGAGGLAVTGPIKRRKVGDVETEFAGVAGGSSNSSAGSYGSTAYGVRYLELKRRNFPAFAFV